jgi:hypothetical protein
LRLEGNSIGLNDVPHFARRTVEDYRYPSGHQISMSEEPCYCL